MANSVKFEVPTGQLTGSKDVFFEVTKGRRFLGTLEVSADHLVWIPAGGSQYKADWPTFDEIMQGNIVGRHPGRRRRVGQR